jgi:pimeloyl-ACP methyl ester carboxylesterase
MRTHLLSLLLLMLALSDSYAQDVFDPADVNKEFPNPLPPQPPQNRLAKWYRQKAGSRIIWDDTRFKCYIWNGMPFRLRYPKNYNPASSTKYPMILFMHGAGESKPNVYENSDHLFWAAELFDTRIENNEWNGFLLFPHQSAGERTYDNSHFDRMNSIIDSLEKYEHFDPHQLIVMGLSSGGGGSLAYTNRHPNRTAVCIPSDPAFPSINVNAVVHIPYWISNSGADDNPRPGEVGNVMASLRNAGADTYQQYYAVGDRFSWVRMWDQTDVNGRPILTDYWKRAHKAQPIVFFGNTRFCADAAVSAKMGITAGFNAYEWQKNTTGTFVNIPGANSNEYTAAEFGAYRVRFKQTASSQWSVYSPQPIVISPKPCATDTLFSETFETNSPYLYFGPSWGYKNYNYFRQSGLYVPGTEVFTQDGAGKQGGLFMLNHTYPSIATGGPDQTTPYAAGDVVWRISYPLNDISVAPNTNYLFSFSVGNQTYKNPFVQIVPVVNGTILTPSNLTPQGAGNGSWTRYSYIWNSGSATTANFELRNNSTINNAIAASENGNDFVIDEISLTKALSPGGVSSGMVLWAKPENLTGTVANGISTWPNAAGGKSLTQTIIASKPSIVSSASDYINFNPVASFSRSGADYLSANGGFAANKTHTAAYIYVVVKSNNTTQSHFFLQENLTDVSFNKVEINLPNNGRISWAAGSLVTNIVEASFDPADVNRPLLWSFSKNNTGTGSGFKQDIRKNGLVITSNNNTGSFTGNDYSLQIGEFDGQVAEAIYYLDGTINAAQQNKIESYLALKYGLTLGSGSFIANYTASDGTIFWRANPVYHNDVFGIGTDNASGLRQAISNSMNTGNGNGAGLFRKGNLVIKARTPLANGSFLVIGHTTDGLVEQSTDLPANASGARRLAREWKVANTGNVGGVDMSFDTSGLALTGGTNLNNFRLMIDADGDGNFTTGSVSTVAASGISGKKINFTNVSLANNAVFTFSTTAPTNGFQANLTNGPIVSATNRNPVEPWVTVQINPNPVKGNAMSLKITAPQSNQLTISIANNSGTTVFEQATSVSRGKNEFTIPVGNLADGVYLLQLKQGNRIITQSFVKSK